MHKPIGILTFHRASNYGAVLQAYALQNTIGRFGAEAEIIDYRCPAVEEDHRPFGRLKNGRHVIQTLLHSPVKIKKDRVFAAYRKRKLVLSEPVTGKISPQTAERYSLFVAGSDQVWNDRLSGMDSTYMMDFAREEQRYSYACSFGFDTFPQGKEETYLRHLSGIRSISLRESSGVDMLRAAGLEARTDLDPTLLLTDAQWRTFGHIPEVKEPYILLYTVSGDLHLLPFARELSAKTGCRILYLNNQYKTNRDLTRIRYASPEEFVGWFAGAEYVLTNSFHGTAFSVIFHRRFKVELESKRKFNVRSRDLLVNCGLEDCILQNSEADYAFRDQWEEPDRKLGSMRDRSLAYIRMIAQRAADREEQTQR